jgi:hypothetical protein
MPARVEVAVDEAYVKETGPAKEVEAALVKETTPEKVSLLVKVEVAVRKPESLVNWEVASFCQKAEVPFVVKTVEEAPIEERPVPPFAIERSFVKESVPPYMLVAERAVVEAYGKTEAVVEVAMKYVEARELVPVAVSLEPFQVRMVPLAEIPERSRPMFPEEVTVPVRPLFPATEVTVPVLEVRQTPPTETQPPFNWMPLAKVEEAEEPETFRYVAWTPAAKVEVAVVEVAIR